MKLIDEKIKALGLTKGQYCEKYGFKFKDFAAKVHTLEAKLEWANTFLKPLGLEVLIVTRGTDRVIADIIEETNFGPLALPEVKGLVGKEEWSGWTPGSREAEDQDDADSLL